MLRVLNEIPEPHGAGEIARRAQLTAAGVRRTLGDLVLAGIVEAVGVGPRKLYQIRRAHPLAGLLAGLFAAERERVDAVFEAVRVAAKGLRPPPHAVWIQGPVATEEDKIGEPIVVGVLVESAELPNPSKVLKAALDELAVRHDVAFQVIRWTPAELEAATAAERAVLASATSLMGSAPSEGVPAKAATAVAGRPEKLPETYQEARALALAAAVAEQLETDPSLIDRARKHVARRLKTASPRDAMDLEEWDLLLRTMPVPRLRRFLVDTGPKATRLRQTLPFAEMLTPKEREAVLAG